MTPQPDAAPRKSDEDSAAVVQKGSDMISARSRNDSSQVKSVQHPSRRHRRRTGREQRTSRSAGARLPQQHERQLDQEEAHRLQVLQAVN